MSHASFKAPQGLLRYVVLAYASRYPVTGAELAVDVKAKTAGLWNPSPGSVYYLVNELKEKKLLILVRDGEGGRKAYIATEEGRAELARASKGLLGVLQREVTLLSLLVSMIDPANAERMEVLKWALSADSGRLSKAKALMI
jgi:DNA-binding PadR family transcriptional regulator